MAIVRIDAEKLAVAQLLEIDGWTHARIGALFGVQHSTITHALRGRKTMLPGRVDQLSAELQAKVLTRTQAAARRAIAAELRKLAEELES